MSVRIAPSILSADFARLGEQIAAVERGGAELIHVDVMDGHFVPNITIGVPVVKSLRQFATVPLDVHLMISEPDRYVDAFALAGAAMISVHVEAAPHLHRTVQAIKAHCVIGRDGKPTDQPVQAGAVINPSTPVHVLEQIAPDLDFVLVMSVNPGFGGQRYIRGSEQKVAAVRALLDGCGNAAPVEIDGGIGLDNIGMVVSAGVRMVVAGSAIFDTQDPERATRALKAAAMAAAAAPVSR